MVLGPNRILDPNRLLAEGWLAEFADAEGRFRQAGEALWSFCLLMSEATHCTLEALHPI